MKTEEHFIGKVAQKAIIVRNGKVLLTRDPRTPEYWELPGGRLNVDESPEGGLRRELQEELGVIANITEVVFLKQFLQGTKETKRALVIIYKATISPDAQLTVDPREICEVGWFSQREISSLKLFPEYREALEKFFS